MATTIDAQHLRRVMAAVCAPVTVVTTARSERPYGATVSSFTSLSLEPPLITVALDRRSSLLREIRQAGRFGVNLLAHGQAELAQRFASRGSERFEGVSWHHSSGLPRLTGTAGWLACDLHQVVEGGDHLLLFGLVTAATRSELPSLAHAYATFGTHSGASRRSRSPILDQIAACSR
jgi:flavin reductase (DIM6/NTAB) family NADH-FMN oxidoreductase RutF